MKLLIVALGIALAGGVAQAFEPTGCPDFTVELPRPGGAVVRAADYGFSRTNDFNTAAINRAVDACRRTGARKVVLEPGEYNCFDAPFGIALTNLTDFTLDGCGAVLVFRRPAEFRCQPQSELVHDTANVLVKGSERVLVEHLKMDWDWARDPLACFAVCDAVHVDEARPNASYVDFTLPDYARYPLYPAPVPVKLLQAMRPTHDGFEPGRRFNYGLSEGHFGAKNEWLAPNRLRVWPAVEQPGKDYNPAYGVRHFSPALNVSETKDYVVGRTYRIMHHHYGKNGFDLVDSRHVTLRDIDIWSCFGMGIVVDGKQKYWQVEDVRVEPRPGVTPRRPISTLVEGCHVARSSGYAKYVRFKVSQNNDDGVNFHDRFTVAERRDARTLEIVNDRGIGYLRPELGDPLELRTPDWRPTGFTATLVATNGNFLTLDREMPVAIGDAFFVFDRAYGTDNVLVRDCVFDNSAYRNLFSCSNLTIENNLFRRVGGRAVWILADARKRLWCEGLGETNIVIRGNTFVDCGVVNRTVPVISTALVSITPWKPTSLAPNFIRDILIEKNRIVDPFGPAFCAEAGSAITFRDNEIVFTREPYGEDSGKVSATGAADVKMTGNIYKRVRPQ